MEERKFYTVEQFAELFQLTPKRVREEIRAGNLEVIKLGFRTTRIPQAEVKRVSKFGLEHKENAAVGAAA